MSSIGVDFILKANTSSFTQGLAKVSNATADLRKGLMKNFDGRDLARGLVTAFGLSIDKIADKFARLWTGVSEEAEAAYNKLGSLTDTLTEKTVEAGSRRLNDEQKYQLALQETARLQVAIAQNLGKTTEQQIKLTEDKIKLLEKQTEAQGLLDKINKDKKERADKDKDKIENERKDNERRNDDEFNRNTERLRQLDEEDKKRVDAAKDEIALAEKADREFFEKVREKFAPTVEQLAQMDVGTGVAQNDPRIVARKIIEQEKRAAILGNRGDIEGAIRVGSQAEAMRESLSNQTGGGTALTQQTAEAAFKAGLEETNAKLDSVEKALAGIIKAQE